MAMKRKSGDTEEVGAKYRSEEQLRAAAKAAIKKAEDQQRLPHLK